VAYPLKFGVLTGKPAQVVGEQTMEGIMGNKQLLILHVLLPIFLGIIIYALWRGLYCIDPTERVFPIYAEHPPNWIMYNLPDGLWLYALLATLILIWKRDLSRAFYLWLIFTIILSFLSELFQALHLIKGTFDWKDLLAYYFAIALYFFNFKNLTNNYK
jgi:hypothetical protein